MRVLGVNIFAFFGLAAIIAIALAGCSPSQEQRALQVSNAGCHIASDVEAADPALAKHNTRIVAGQTEICGVVSVLSAPPQAAAPVPAAVSPATPHG